MCWRDERGFTLAELLTALAMVATVLAAAVMIESGALQAYVTGSNKTEVQQNARVALERMAREIRQATTNPGTGQPGLTVATATSLSFYDQNTGLTTYVLNGTTLTRTANGVDEVIIGRVQVPPSQFAYRDINDTVLGVPVATPANVYRVDITIRAASEDTVVTNGVADTRADLTTTVRLRNCVSSTAPCS
jgi:prepilin-type N-terminal cleavage/methylation domain-containing protein